MKVTTKGPCAVVVLVSQQYSKSWLLQYRGTDYVFCSLYILVANLFVAVGFKLT